MKLKNFKLYTIGGCVRDQILGRDCDDIDFSVEFLGDKSQNVNVTLDELVKELRDNDFNVFVVYKDTFTIKAKFPENNKFAGKVADFVLCRKELGYDYDSRKPEVVVGTLFNDQQRRDFTINTIARGLDGRLEDPFNGITDIYQKILKTPIDPMISFQDDPLRVIRLFRFAITLGFDYDQETLHAALKFSVWEKLDEVVSKERMQVEFAKMFEADTKRSLAFINALPEFCKDIVLSKIKIKISC